jgi:ankyrin repeat protein
LGYKAGNTGAVRLLIEKGHALVDALNDAHETPLAKAAKREHISTVEALLDIGNANINAKNNADGVAALTKAIMGGHEAVVKFLISRGVHLNDTDNREERHFIGL